MDVLGVTARGARLRYNLSISDLLMDSLIKNDSIDLLYMVMPRAVDESICGKLSHPNSVSIRCKIRNTSWERHRDRRSTRCI